MGNIKCRQSYNYSLCALFLGFINNANRRQTGEEFSSSGPPTCRARRAPSGTCRNINRRLVKKYI